MTDSVRYILLLVGVVIILLLLWDGLRRKKRQQREAPIRTVDLKLVKEKLADKQAKQPAESYSSGVIIDPAVASEMSFKPSVSVSYDASAQVAEKTQAPVQLEPEPVLPAQTTRLPLKPSPFLMLHLKAPEGQTYAGFALLQNLLSVGLQFGERGFFHRYAEDGSTILFSVAANQAPGTFDPRTMREYECEGLMLFMTTDEVAHPQQVFKEMQNVSQALLRHLGGHLYIGQSTPYTEEQVAQLFARYGW